MKKLIILCLTVVLCISSISTPALATIEGKEVMSDEIGIKYQHISSISAGLAIYGSMAVASATATITGNYESRVIVQMLRSKSVDGAYTTYERWSKSFTGKGSKFLNKSLTVPKGYTYRIKVTLKVYNSKGDLIETATKKSIRVIYN